MGLFRWWRHVQENMRVYEFDNIDPRLVELADAIYLQLVEWFGPPVDAGTQFQVILGPAHGCGRDRLTGHYILMVSVNAESEPERIGAIAHEMYHRVTNKSTGLRSVLWIDEMMAFLTEQRILQQYGFGGYGQSVREAYAAIQSIPVAELNCVRAKRGLFGSNNEPYPEGFMATLAKLGLRLQDMVGWDNLALIPRCDSWHEWIAKLPARDQDLACSLLRSYRLI